MSLEKLQIGDFKILKPKSQDKSKSSSGSSQTEPENVEDFEKNKKNPIFKDEAELMKGIPRVGQEEKGKGTKRDITNSLGRKITGKAKDYKGEKKSIIYKKNVKPNWSELSNNAMSRNSSSLSDKAKSLLRRFKATEPLVDWKKELKKFFDNTLSKEEWAIPNKRYLSSGNVLYGRKKAGEDTLKTIVAAVDTSSSISNEQAKVFVNEIMYLCKKFNADKTVIIYCSDDIDGIDIIKKGGSPDFTKMGSTGGNRKGFIPPFQEIEKMKINPSLFVYLTDTGGEMPDPNKYGIKKYIKKVMWFVCSPTMYNKPPFGKILFAPVAAIRK